MNDKRGIESPEDHDKVKVSKPKENSAGIPAIRSGLKHVLTYMDRKDAFATLTKLNQKGGIDCPGCAWPDPEDDRSKLGEYCENGMKAIAEEATNRRIDASFFASHTIEALRDKTDFELGKLGRIAEPMLLQASQKHYQPISWDDAFEMIGSELNALNHPDEAIFYTSGRTSNEAAFLYQLFVRAFGTNNLPDCSNMCHESSGAALSETLGIGKGSVTLHDLHVAEVIIIMGQNPGTNHPRMMTALEKCKQNGGKIIAINPLPECGLIRYTNPQNPISILKGGVKLADLFLQVRINGDIALLKALMLLLMQEEEKAPGSVFDREFIEEHTSGYEAFYAALKEENIDECLSEAGIDRSLAEEAAAMLRQKKKIIVCWAMGLTQHKNGVDNIKEVVNLLLLKGAIGKEGAGTCPVRGHSNVQGDRTMGIWESPPKSFLESIEKHFGFKPPEKHGTAVVDAIKALKEKKARVFMSLGGNFLSATPDTAYTAAALQNCRLQVHISTKLNRAHLVPGEISIILPCLGRTEIDIQGGTEQFVSVENSMGIVHSSKGVLPPCSPHLKSEPAIIASIARSTLKDRVPVDWEFLISNYDHIRSAIESCIPGFQAYNERVRTPSGFYLPNGARIRKFNTQNGTANFSVNSRPDMMVPDGYCIMMTIRSHDQYNTTIYGLEDRYRGIHGGRRVVLMNEDDMKSWGFKAMDLVDLNGHADAGKRVAKHFRVVPYPIPRGNVATYFPEANVLVPIHSYDTISKTPASKRVVIRITKSENSA